MARGFAACGGRCQLPHDWAHRRAACRTLAENVILHRWKDMPCRQKPDQGLDMLNGGKGVYLRRSLYRLPRRPALRRSDIIRLPDGVMIFRLGQLSGTKHLQMPRKRALMQIDPGFMVAGWHDDALWQPSRGLCLINRHQSESFRADFFCTAEVLAGFTRVVGHRTNHTKGRHSARPARSRSSLRSYRRAAVALAALGGNG